MLRSKNALVITAILISGSLIAACRTPNDNANTTATTTVTPPPTQTLNVVQPPERITQMRQQRGELEEARPVLQIVSPRNNAVLEDSTVEVRLALSGDLRGYKPGKDPATGEGDHIHVILDNEPYEAYYHLSEPFVFRDVSPGQHTIRVFASRSWHESYKNEGSFQMVTFTVRGDQTPAVSPSPAASPSPATTPSPMASPSPPVVGTTPTQELPDPQRPLLTYSRPKVDYQGEEADPIMIDFWLTNARLKDDGGEYRVRYIIDDDEPRYIDRWEPIWLSGWTAGKHSVRLELIGPDGSVVENGAYNTTTREITVVK